jgi:hypothetical protein
MTFALACGPLPLHEHFHQWFVPMFGNGLPNILQTLEML